MRSRFTHTYVGGVGLATATPRLHLLFVTFVAVLSGHGASRLDLSGHGASRLDLV